MKEEDIRPQKIFDKYLELAKIDIETYFTNVPRHVIKCPACGKNGVHAFQKNGFDYSTCQNCDTLYVSPRPENSAFNQYYTEAPASKYWATTFYKATADARREKLWKPKVNLIQHMTERFGSGNEKIVDIGGVHI